MIIEAKPFAFELRDPHPALIVIDMQRDFLEPGGFGSALGNDVNVLAKAIPVVEKLLRFWRAANWPVIHTREAHRPDMSDCPPAKRNRGGAALGIGDAGPMGRILIDGEPGNEIVPALRPQPGEIEITKPGKGAFYATDLQRMLERMQVSQLFFAGVTTEVCVQTSMREANDRGYECLLVEDATESYFPHFKQATIDMVIAQGAIVGWVASSDTVLKALAQFHAHA